MSTKEIKEKRIEAIKNIVLERNSLENMSEQEIANIYNMITHYYTKEN